MGLPSRVTSNRPPLDGIISISAVGNFSRIAAARLTARGS
jgi:hypothetical protein